MSGDTALRVRVPRDPLELHLAVKNMRVLQNAHYRVLGSEVCRALPRDAFGVPVPRFFCAICSHGLELRFPLHSSVAEPLPALPSAKLRPLSRFRKSLPDTARRREEGSQSTDWGGERASSPTTQIAQKNHSAGERSGRGSASHTPPPSTGFFKAR